MSAVKSATLPVAGATAQSKCREALKHTQSYRRCLHQHPLTVAGASPSPSPLHTHATCTRSGSSLGMWVSPMEAVACFPTPCWKSMWLLKNSASFTPHEFRITAVNGFDCNLEALNLVCYILLWGGGAGQKIQKRETEWASSFNLRNYFSRPSSRNIFPLCLQAMYQSSSA